MKKKYTHIFFDLDNTLWDFKRNSKLALMSSFRMLGLEDSGTDFEEFYAVYTEINSGLWKAYRNKQIRKKELTFNRFQKTFERLNIDGVDAAQMNETYLSEMPKQNLLIPGAQELLQHLKSKNYKLFIITNGFREVQNKKLENAGLKHYFTNVYISEDLRSPKPAKEIFEHAVKSSNAKKISSLMVGDDWEVDVMGAIKFGIDAVFFHPNGNSDSTNNSSNELNNKVFIVENLGDILSFLR